MKNETTLPVYTSLEALLAAELALASDFPSWGAAMGEWALATEKASA